MPATDDAGGDGSGLSLEEQLAALAPPRPIDVIIQPQTACVVITGACGVVRLLSAALC
jgi:hypothetical protein